MVHTVPHNLFDKLLQQLLDLTRLDHVLHRRKDAFIVSLSLSAFAFHYIIGALCLSRLHGCLSGSSLFVLLGAAQPEIGSEF